MSGHDRSEEVLAARVAASADDLRADLERLVRIPSVAFPGHPPGPLREAAEATAELLAAAGLPGVELLETSDGPPLVWGAAPAPPGAPTVLLYAHYDVQPAGPATAWTTPPFEPVERDGRLHGRGTADDKCGIVMHAGALRAHGGRPPVGVKVVVEGDEETGRGTLAGLIAAEPERFAADVMVLADVGNWCVGEPTLVTSLRGLAVVDVEVRTLVGEVHSGLYGGLLPDALIVLARMLATLHAENGDVAVAGLAHGTWDGREPAPATVREAGGLCHDVALVGSGTLGDRLYARPSITAIGLDAPAVDGARNALVPDARARLSARLAPGQRPEDACEAIKAHLGRVVPWRAELRVALHGGTVGVVAGGDGPGLAAAERALERAYGKPPVRSGNGGGIPLCADLARAFPGAELVLWGACDDGARIHAADESVALDELQRATLAEALFLSEVADARFNA